MALYKDLFTGDELLSSYFDTKDVDDVVWEAEGAFVTKRDDNNFDIGANPSADGADEGEGVYASTAEQVINIADNFRLNKMEGLFPKKADFVDFMKGYMSKLGKKLKENGKSDEEAKAITDGIKKYSAGLLKDFKQLEFYTGETMDLDGQVAILHWKNNDKGEEAPFFTVWKHGVKTEKI